MSAAICCGHPSGLTIAECVERGLKTRRLVPFDHQCNQASYLFDLWARFSFQIEAGTLTALRFECTACATLIACCQALVELLSGQKIEHAQHFSAASLLQQLSGVPAAKQNRAWLAVSAFGAGLHSFQSTQQQEVTS